MELWNQLHEQACRRVDDYLHAEGLVLETLIDIDRERVFEKFQCTHLTPYCVRILGLSEPVAETFVRVVRQSHQVPELAQAVKERRVSLSNAKVIASVITPENKSEWLSKATTLAKSKLEREVAQANGRETKTVRFELTFDDLEILKRCREVLCAKLGRALSGEETLHELMDAFLEQEDPVRAADRPRARSVVKQVDRRDRGECQFTYPDGTKCRERKWVQKHHIKPRAEGGQDTLENLITYCSGHHRMVHALH